MQIKFDSIRDEYNHKGNMGSNIEQIVRNFLTEFLPPTNRIGEGEVIDSFDNVSNQLDIIITNDGHPYLNDLSKPSKFFIEGVSFAGEVKTSLTSQELTTTLDKCLSFKNLVSEPPSQTIAYSNPEDVERFLNKRPFFLFAFTSQLSLETITNKVNEYNSRNILSVPQQIDGIFILDRGYIINLGSGKGSFRFGNSETQRFIPGYVMFDISNYPNVLLDFTTWMHVVMPRFVFLQSIMIPYLRNF